MKLDKKNLDEWFLNSYNFKFNNKTFKSESIEFPN
jgi:hypothetical protein